MICFNTAANAQTSIPADFTAKSDTIYFLDGRIIATNILDTTNPEHIAYGKWDWKSNTFTDIIRANRSGIHYIYTKNEYSLITENSVEFDFERLRYNMLRYQEASRKGMLTLTSGVGLVVLGMLTNELLQNTTTDFPKYFNYLGYGAMFVGGMITIGSYKYLEYGSVDITPVGVKINF